MSSVREGRIADRVTKFVVAKLKERDHLVTVVDPKELNLPVIGKRYDKCPEGTAPQALKQLFEVICHADAFLIVSAEYNHSIPPALTNMLDHFTPSNYKYRPSAIVCYSISPYGGVRAAMQLRAFLAELQTPSIPRLFPVPSAHQNLDEDGNPLEQDLNVRIVGFLDEVGGGEETHNCSREFVCRLLYAHPIYLIVSKLF
jgi:NAD(P)H-dependent FMN reductase